MPFFFDLSARAKLRLTGADRMRFINGQITNDVRKTSAGAALQACVLSAKGRLEAELFLFATDDAIWIDTDRELREGLAGRLERYVIADDVTIKDITDEFALFHIQSPTAPPIPGTQFCVQSLRLRDAGWDVWCAANEAERVKQTLAREATFLGEAALECRRIEEGIPRWGHELTPDVIPPEANLDRRAIDYEKGCYIGQEVISRMKMSGQVRQRLCGVTTCENLHAGTELRAEEKSAGRITSAVFSERIGTHLGLAMIKRQFTTAGTELQAVSDGRSVPARVVALPFTS